MRAFMSWLRIEVKGHLTQSLVVEPQFCQRIQQFPLEKNFQNLISIASNGWAFGIGITSQYRKKQFQTRRGTCSKMSHSSVYCLLYISAFACLCKHNKALSCIRPTLERRPPLKWVESEYSSILQGGDYRPEHFKWTERSGNRTFTIKHSWNDFVFEHLRGVLIYGIYLFMVL